MFGHTSLDLDDEISSLAVLLVSQPFDSHLGSGSRRCWNFDLGFAMFGAFNFDRTPKEQVKNRHFVDLFYVKRLFFWWFTMLARLTRGGRRTSKYVSKIILT